MIRPGLVQKGRFFSLVITVQNKPKITPKIRAKNHENENLIHTDHETCEKIGILCHLHQFLVFLVKKRKIRCKKRPMAKNIIPELK